MNKARWDAERKLRDEEESVTMHQLEEVFVENLPRAQSDVLGRLEWTDYATGKVRRWIVRIGKRADQVTMEAPGGRRTGSHGWTWVMDHLRGFLAGRKV